MPEIVPPSPDQDKTPRAYATEPARKMDYAVLPADITLRPEGIHFKRNIFVVSVATMVFTSLVTFFIPFFNGLLGGAFGGFHAGRMKRALGAAALSSVLTPGIILFLYAFYPQGLMRIFSDLGIVGWVALHVIGTFIGAVSGSVSRPLFDERTLLYSSHVTAAPGPQSGAAPVSPRSEEPIVPPSGPARGV